jgi:general secretion pathway protein J
MNYRSNQLGLARQTGFTLIEFIVASAVLAIMSGVAYAGWFNVTRIADLSQDTMERYDNLQRTFYWFSQDFEQIVQRDSVDELGGKRKSLEVSEAGEYLIEITRGGWSNPALLQMPPRSDLQRVAYYIDDDNRLLRRYWYHVDQFDGATYNDRLLLTDMAALTFRFYDSSGEWENKWPPEDNIDEDFNLMPLAIEATIELEDMGSVRRLFILPN